jgi:hypothetical protein
MGYVKNAMIEVMEAGCVWLDDDVIVRMREAGLAPQTRRVIVEGYRGPVELDALPASEGLRLLPLVTGDDREALADALAEMM